MDGSPNLDYVLITRNIHYLAMYRLAIKMCFGHPIMLREVFITFYACIEIEVNIQGMSRSVF